MSQYTDRPEEGKPSPELATKRPSPPASDAAVDVALAYIEAGFHVVTLLPGTKKPRVVLDEQKNKWVWIPPTNDPDEIRSRYKQHPGDGLAVILGGGCSPGICCMDIDADKGGLDTAKYLKETFGTPPPTVFSRTGNPNGRNVHVYFRYDTTRALRPFTGLGPGIDFMGGGKWRVLVEFPTRHEKPPHNPYMWAGDNKDFAPWSEKVGMAAMMEWMYQPPDPEPVPIKREAPNINGNGHAEPGSREYHYCRSALVNAEDELAAIVEGERNTKLNEKALKLATFFHYGAYSEAEVVEALLRACGRNGLWTDDGKEQCVATIKSGWSGGLSHPKVIDFGDPFAGFTTESSDEDSADAGTLGADPNAESDKRIAEKIRQHTLKRTHGTTPKLRRKRLLGGLLVRGAVTLVSGAWKTHKSHWALLAAVSLAIGKPIAGFPVGEPVKVMLVMQEDDAADFDMLTAALVIQHGLTEADEALIDSNLVALGVTDQPFLFGQVTRKGELQGFDPQVAALTRYIQSDPLEPVGVMIVDPFRPSISGLSGIDEAMIARVLVGFKTLAMGCDMAVLITHHFNKQAGRKADEFAGDAAATFGSSAMLSGTRMIFTLTRMHALTGVALGFPQARVENIVRLDYAAGNYRVAKRLVYYEAISHSFVALADGPDGGLEADDAPALVEITAEVEKLQRAAMMQREFKAIDDSTLRRLAAILVEQGGMIVTGPKIANATGWPLRKLRTEFKAAVDANGGVDTVVMGDGRAARIALGDTSTHRSHALTLKLTVLEGADAEAAHAHSARTDFAVMEVVVNPFAPPAETPKDDLEEPPTEGGGIAT